MEDLLHPTTILWKGKRGGGIHFEYQRANFYFRFFKFLCNQEDITFEGNLLFTGPGEIPAADHRLLDEIITETIKTPPTPKHESLPPEPRPTSYGSVSNRETLGSKEGVPNSESQGLINTVSSRSSTQEIPLSGTRQRGSRSAHYVSLREEEEETIWLIVCPFL